MQAELSYQVHANVNMEGRDMALRVTLTVYDAQGNEVNSRTWRRHTVGQVYDGLEWTAAHATTELAKLMRDRLADGHGLEDIQPETTLPLF